MLEIIGLLGKASEAKQETLEATEKEEIGLAMTEAIIGENGYQELNQANLQNAINNQFGEGKATVINNGDGSFIIRLNNKEYQISNSKNITKLEKVKDSTPRRISW